MSAKDGLTIAIPSFNRRDSVVSLVEAIVPQLSRQDELLVVDDGSQDGTPEALSQISPVRLLRNFPHRGMVNCWNTCLLSACKNWICIIHDDDAVASQGLQTIRRACHVASGPAFIAHQTVHPELDSCFRYRALEPGPFSVLNSSVAPSGATIHREIINSAGVFDERFTYSPDIEYFARISGHFKTIVIESPAVAHSRFHDRNYQYQTWHQPDFLAQLEEIERLVIEYAGVEETEGVRQTGLRMRRHFLHMFSAAARIRDKELLRQVGRRLFKLPDVGHRLRLAAYVAATFGWCP